MSEKMPRNVSKNDDEINAMLPCLPWRHAGRDTLQAATFKMLF